MLTISSSATVVCVLSYVGGLLLVVSGLTKEVVCIANASVHALSSLKRGGLLLDLSKRGTTLQQFSLVLRNLLSLLAS